MASTCKSCGAPIIWIQAPSKKWIPCDEGLVPYKLGGNDSVVTQDGAVLRVTLTDENPTGLARTPHWATCPDADKFRRRK